jgi:hypothetical protein
MQGWLAPIGSSYLPQHYVAGNAMRYVIFFVFALLALIPCYVIGGAVQLSISQVFVDADAPRMAYERMPYLLLLSPIAPALAFDGLIQDFSTSRLAWFACFFVPFLVLYGLCVRWLARTCSVFAKQM